MNRLYNALWNIEKYMMQKYGVDAAQREIDPLKWYIYTGRAPLAFLYGIEAARPFMIARILHKGGSYNEALDRIKAYLKIKTTN